ncbi:MAG: hypothetical protein KDK36_13380 [Leptospiraceae bacterium]|nr:hypothetical protein [Leptospiraceae bacterium]
MIDNQENSNSPKRVGDSELIQLSGEELKKKSLENSEVLYEKIKELEKDINLFNRNQKPTFDKWMLYHFKDKIDEIKELKSNVERKKNLIKQAQEELYFFKINPEEAFKKVQRRLEGIELNLTDNSGDNRPYATYNVDEEDDVMGEELNDFFESLNQKLESEKEVTFENISSIKFKERYRYLITKLHPDKLGRPLTIEEKELWTELNSAYKEGDSDRLEEVFVKYKFLNKEISANSSLFDLRFSEKKLKDKFDKLKAEMREIKNSDAWNFNKLSESEVFERQKKISNELKDFIYSLRKENEQLEEVIELFSNTKKQVSKEKIEEKLEKDFIEMYLNF